MQLCEVLDVQKSSYYYWQGHRQPTAQRLRLQVHARAVHTETHQTYGSRRMSAAMKAQGLAVGRHRARSLMREAGLVAVRPKKRHSYPAGEVSRVADNHLDRHKKPASPTKNGSVTSRIYGRRLAGCTSRRVVDWSLSASPDTPLILAALNQAAVLRQITPGIGLLFHSDHTSHAYQDRLAELGIQASMSRRGNCWEGLLLGYNAVMERFFRSLKVEAISRDRYQTQDEMVWAVKKYIHFYNTKRLHSTIGSVSPNQYEQVFLKQA